MHQENDGEFNADQFADDEMEDRGNPLMAELERPNIHREEGLKFLEFMFNALRAIKSYQGNKEFALDCFLAALGGSGWAIIGGANDQSELAAKWGCTKANVSKLVKKFQAKGFLNLPPAPGQRDLTGCRVMKQKRKGQLKP